MPPEAEGKINVFELDTHGGSHETSNHMSHVKRLEFACSWNFKRSAYMCICIYIYIYYKYMYSLSEGGTFEFSAITCQYVGYAEIRLLFRATVQIHMFSSSSSPTNSASIRRFGCAPYLHAIQTSSCTLM